MHNLSADQLERLAYATIRALGGSDAEAKTVATHLVEANLAGHDSHGVGMLPDYVRLVQDGHTIPGQEIGTIVDFGALLILDAGRGFGQWMAKQAMQRGIERAREVGACVMGLRNSSHVGRIGHYVEQCAASGMASLHFVNVADHRALQAPFGCSDVRLGTNPFAAGIPGDDGPAVMLDMATSTIAFGKARIARNKGVAVPAGALIDEDGRPTTDPQPMVDHHRGSLMAFGAHKGSGLAVLCELFGAALTGGQTIQPGHARSGGTLNSILSVIIDTARMGDLTSINTEIEAVKDWIRASPPAPGFDEVLLPGEPEQRARAGRMKDGIPLDDKSFADILAAAGRAGVDASVLDQASLNLWSNHG